ncbi:MAG: DUF4252 domain-containing protein [Acidobacteriaceae bacterium]|jgi:hypothetical protein
MRRGLISIVLLFAGFVAGAALPATAQSSQPPFPVTLEKQLAERASNYTEVTLDRKMLDFASRFMNDKDDAEGKRIVEKLNGVYVRSYEFDKPGQYTPADLDAVRRQFDTAEWSTLVKTRSKDASDDADIYMKLVNGEVQGMFILSSEPKELDFVFISGPIRPEDLQDLSGNFGIPKDSYKLALKAKDKDKDTEKDKAQKKADEKAQKGDGKTQKEAQQ